MCITIFHLIVYILGLRKCNIICFPLVPLTIQINPNFDHVPVPSQRRPSQSRHKGDRLSPITKETVPVPSQRRPSQSHHKEDRPSPVTKETVPVHLPHPNQGVITFVSVGTIMFHCCCGSCAKISVKIFLGNTSYRGV